MKRSLAAALAALAALALLAACGDDDIRRRRHPTTTTAAASRVPSASCRCRATPPRCSSPSAPATRWWPSTTSPTSPRTPRPRDLSAYEPNVEAIATYEPDLVVRVRRRRARGEPRAARHRGARRSGGRRRSTTPTSRSRSSARSPGTRTRPPTSSTEMQDDIEDLAGRGSGPSRRPLTYYHELDSTLYSVTSEHVHRRSCTAWPGSRTSPTPPTPTAQTGGYPQLSAEFLVRGRPRPHRSWPTRSAASRRGDLRRPARLRRPAGGRRTARSSCSTTTSPAAGARAIVDLLRTIIEAVKAVPAA